MRLLLDTHTFLWAISESLLKESLRSCAIATAAPIASRQRQPLQACNPFEISIETHQAPAIGDR